MKGPTQSLFCHLLQCSVCVCVCVVCVWRQNNICHSGQDTCSCFCSEHEKYIATFAQCTSVSRRETVVVSCGVRPQCNLVTVRVRTHTHTRSRPALPLPGQHRSLRRRLCKHTLFLHGIVYCMKQRIFQQDLCLFVDIELTCGCPTLDSIDPWSVRRNAGSPIVFSDQWM